MGGVPFEGATDCSACRKLLRTCHVLSDPQTTMLEVLPTGEVFRKVDGQDVSLDAERNGLVLCRRCREAALDAAAQQEPEAPASDVTGLARLAGRVRRENEEMARKILRLCSTAVMGTGLGRGILERMGWRRY